MHFRITIDYNVDSNACGLVTQLSAGSTNEIQTQQYYNYSVLSLSSSSSIYFPVGCCVHLVVDYLPYPGYSSCCQTSNPEGEALVEGGHFER